MRNVMLPAVYADITKSTRNTKAESLLTQVGLSHRLQSTPSELSGGEQQRVAIARALMNTPDLLLADEPTGALDSKSGGEVMKIIQDLNKKGMTIIMVTHEEEIAAYADRTIYLRDGVVVSHDKKLSTNQPNNA
jgi:putative ABC transport system ATP-binding protein